jgi:hypothetical protein
VKSVAIAELTSAGCTRMRAYVCGSQSISGPHEVLRDPTGAMESSNGKLSAAAAFLRRAHRT